ncbi:ubiquitin-conjugating enzyme/RWD-like protein [Tribonema minus]|uniref:Ubiquitin-conjugating enzyme/RWD-like protein n=1 Tax=Tribonema minus TaxID=303371 RepID=A0A835YZU8_9STRA|nr:ubiquitin-conjugating enzyme/RWD-like protein [Tribonema minus]
MDVDEDAGESSAAAAAAPAEEGAGDGGEGGGVKLLGIGGRRTKKTGKAPPKKTPGEIRIQKDIAELDGGTVATITFPDPNNLCKFEVLVTPDSGYWKGASYNFTFTIPGHYPHDPPKVLCNTKIYHPNINLQGNVCLNILREDWKPVLDINAVIYGLIYLFYEPNPEDPLNHEAAELYRNNIAEFQRIVRRTLQGCNMNGQVFPRLV